MIIGTLNAILQADTSAWDKGMQKAGGSLTSLREQTAQQTQQINKGLSTLGDMSGLTNAFASQTGQVQGILGQMGSVIRSFMGALGTPIGAIIGAAMAASAAVVGLGFSLHSMASKGAEAIMTMRHLAQELDVSMAALSRLGNFGGDGLGHAMIRMQRGVEDGSEAMAKALSKIGLSVADLKDISADQQLRMITRGFSELTSQGERASVAMALFGRGGREMIEDLRKGEAGLDAAAARAQRFGQVVTDAQADAIKRAGREWSGLGAALDGIGKQAAAMFAPLWEKMGKVGSSLGEWLVNAFRNAQPVIESFGNKFVQVFGPIWDFFTRIGSTIGDMITSAIPAIGKFGEFFLSFAGAVLKFITGWEFFSELFKGSGNSVADVWHSVINWVMIALDVAIAFYDAVSSVAKVIATTMADGLRAILAQFGDIKLSWTDLREVILRVLATVVVHLNNIGRLWDYIVNGIKLKWLTFLQDMVNMIPESMRNRMSGFLPDMSGVSRQIREITRLLREQTNDINQEVEGLMDRWRMGFQRLHNEWNPNVNVGNNDWDPFNQRARSGLLNAVSGHDATLRGSQRAFTLLNSTADNQDYYQALMVANQRSEIQLLRDIQQDFRQAPAIRRARL